MTYGNQLGSMNTASGGAGIRPATGEQTGLITTVQSTQALMCSWVLESTVSISVSNKSTQPSLTFRHVYLQFDHAMTCGREVS